MCGKSAADMAASRNASLACLIVFLVGLNLVDVYAEDTRGCCFRFHVSYESFN
ncbi:hypothetical protein M758_6G042000 [Ceratodon purpureus]|nr:hypothetical protein M758_6G042000 [Ceratodon purpureus]